MLDHNVAIKAVALAQFRPFTRADWDAFAGCESPDPLIAETQIDGVDYIIVADGDQLFFNPVGSIDDSQFSLYNLKNAW